MAATMTQHFNPDAMHFYQQEQDSTFSNPFGSNVYSTHPQQYQYAPVGAAYRHSLPTNNAIPRYPMQVQIPQRKQTGYEISPTSTSFFQSWSGSPLSPADFPHNLYHQSVQPIEQAPPTLPMAPTPHPSFAHGGPAGLGLTFDDGQQSRQQSFASIASSMTLRTSCSELDTSHSETSRSSSPMSSDLTRYGYLNSAGTWTCNYQGCQSKAVFTRGCDLRKHHKRHTKSFFCNHPGCAQQGSGGFSSKKDLARHEAKHNPLVVCEWPGCERVFSRVDNMRDHVKRIHQRKQARRGSRMH